MTYKPEVLVSGKWSRNALVFATEQEAKDNAHDLMMRWFAVDDSRAVEVDEPATHSYADRVLVALPYIATGAGGATFTFASRYAYDQAMDWTHTASPTLIRETCRAHGVKVVADGEDNGWVADWRLIAAEVHAKGGKP
jgi:hypothetical protein